MEKESRAFSKREHKVSREVSRFFARLEKEVLKNLKENWDYISFSFQLPKITEPILRNKDDYIDLLDNELNPIYENGRNIARRRYEYAKYISETKNTSTKSDEYFYSSSLSKRIKKIRWSQLERNNIELAQWKRTKPNPLDNSLFGYSSQVNRELHQNNFVASEKTMNRVNQEINNILANCYNNGEGIDETGKAIKHKFSMLKGYEANRIARTETHTAQELGIQDEYDTLGVEYTQWLTHIDERTRTSHQEINKQIIRRGSTFSNGLRYPGDKSGPIEEWINCRCVDIPYIPPAGMMFPPGQIRYKESDLIPDPTFNSKIKEFSVDDLLSGKYKEKLRGTLELKPSKERIEELYTEFAKSYTFRGRDKITDNEFDELLKKYEELLEKYHLEELDWASKEGLFFENFSEYAMWQSGIKGEKFANLQDDWMIFEEVLTRDFELDYFESRIQSMSEKEILDLLDTEYGITKKTLEKFKEIYSKLKLKRNLSTGKERFLDFMDRFYFGTKPIKAAIPPKYDRLGPADRITYEHLKRKRFLSTRQKEFLAECEKRAKDTNIITRRVTKNISDFRNGEVLYKSPFGSKIEDEEFIEFYFKDRNLTIYFSTEIKDSSRDTVSITKILDYLDSKDDILKESLERIVITNRNRIYSQMSGQYVGGWANNKGIVVKGVHGMKKVEDILAHEGGHKIDRRIILEHKPHMMKDNISGDAIFQRAYDKDMSDRISGRIIKTDKPSNLARQDNNKIWISRYAENKRYYGRNDYVEAVAECWSAYFNEPSWFKRNYPHTYNYFDDVVKRYKNFREPIKMNQSYDIEDIFDYEDIVTNFNLNPKDNILLDDLEQLKAMNNGILPSEYKNVYQKLSSQRRFNELYSLKLKQGGLNRRNTKLYIREYIKLREMGYDFPKGELDVFKDININFALGKYNKSILEELSNGRYISRLRYKLGLIDLTDDEIYYLLSMYLSPTPPGFVRGVAIATSNWVTED